MADSALATTWPAEGAVGFSGRQTGWLVAIGSPGDRRYPGIGRRARLWAFVGGFPLMFTAAWLTRYDRAVSMTIMYGFMAIQAQFEWIAPLIADAVARRSLRRRVVQACAPTNLADAPSGVLVRVIGRIESQATIASLFRGERAVLSRVQLGAAVETRGTDHWIRTLSGERVRVHVRDAFFEQPMTLVEGAPACPPLASDRRENRLARLVPAQPGPRSFLRRLVPQRLREASVGPEDLVEVCGLLRREVFADGAGMTGRSPPLCWSLSGSETDPLVVRRLSAEEAAALATASEPTPEV